MHNSTMSGSDSAPLYWFAFSPALAPELWPERLEGAALPALPEGELAEALDEQLVHDVPSEAWGGRVARLVEAPGQRVMGRVRAVPASGWSQVARVERALAQATQARGVRVRTASGVLVSARAFTSVASAVPTSSEVSVAYLVALARAAEHARLPPPYVERLQAEAQLVQRVQGAHAQRVSRP